MSSNRFVFIVLGYLDLAFFFSAKFVVYSCNVYSISEPGNSQR